MPNRALSGAVNKPDLVVAPTKVKGCRPICTERALGPLSIMISIRKSSMAEYRYSSTTGLRRCISSMKSTSPACSPVNRPAKSPGFSRTGPLVILICAFISLAMRWAKVVFPNPGGPCNKTWSKASPRPKAAATKTLRLSMTLSCPAKSPKVLGLS